MVFAKKIVTEFCFVVTYVLRNALINVQVARSLVKLNVLMLNVNKIVESLVLLVEIYVLTNAVISNVLNSVAKYVIFHVAMSNVQNF